MTPCPGVSHEAKYCGHEDDSHAWSGIGMQFAMHTSWARMSKACSYGYSHMQAQASHPAVTSHAATWRSRDSTQASRGIACRQTHSKMIH